MLVAGLWQPGAPAPVLTGLKYRPDATAMVSTAWTSTAIGGGPIASPVLSADGTVAYVTGRDNRLWAIDTADGSAKWSVALDSTPRTPPSVTPDGHVIAGGGPGSHLVSVTDSGEIAWSRDDVEPLTTSTQSGGGTGYAVIRDGDAGQALLVFDTADGRTLNQYPLPEADGAPLGVSVGHDRRVVVTTGGGQVYSFAPA
jgi:outer membrane protein assembly factor BamB